MVEQQQLCSAKVSQASRPGLQQSSRASSPLLAFRLCCTWSPASCSNSTCPHFPWMTTHARVCLFARCAQVLACNQSAGICCRTRSCLLTKVATCRALLQCRSKLLLQAACPLPPACRGTPPYISAAGLPCCATLVPVFAANSVLVGLTSVSALAGPTTTRGSCPRRQQTLAGREATAHRQYDLIV